ncbi:sigma factor [Pseudonocardia nigra]|uniref:sigma factor n=1 Tax=Pseudonocardia nigra TaxID=1921578 RepID=UPI0027E2EC9A|nr:sigma factor [Pseudonocardia nigra]
MTDQPAPAPDDARRARTAAFARYVEPEVAVLYRVALTLAGQRADAEDLVQDTLVRAYRAVDRFDGAHPRARGC